MTRTVYYFFFLNDTATTEIYTLAQHAPLPIPSERMVACRGGGRRGPFPPRRIDRKSTRLNSSHSQISYAVFCLKKKKETALAICWPISSARCTPLRSHSSHARPVQH